MKNSVKKKTRKLPSPSKRKNNEPQNAYLYELDSYQDSSKSNNLASSVQMLVSISQTQRFKLDFLVSSYEQLIFMFKEQRKEFLQIMRTNFQRHHFYYSQINKLIKHAQQNTKKVLRSKLQDISNIFQLKISFIQMKLKSVRKVLFQNHDIDTLFCNRKNKIKNPSTKKMIQIGKTSSYEQGLDFDQQLKQVYSQKSFQIGLNFVENQEVQSSLQNMKFDLIKNWEARESSSVSFSSLSNPEQVSDTFEDDSDHHDLDQNNIEDFFRIMQKEKLNSQKTSNKYPYCSNQTNTSAKQKQIHPSNRQNSQQKQKQHYAFISTF